MASFMSLSIVLAALVFSINAGVVRASSNEFKVGGSIGWREPNSNDTQIYSRWASKIRFQVGDSLYFEYQNDSVLVVDKRAYYHCVLLNPISSFHDGKTVVKIDRPGPFYFISGAQNHCNEGQRLIVDVISPHVPHPPPQPTSSGYTPSPSPDSSSAVSTMATLSPVLMAVATLAVPLVGHA